MLGMIIYYWQKIEYRALRKYKTSIVHTKTGVINAEVVLMHSENIYLGENSYVNGGRLCAGQASEN